MSEHKVQYFLGANAPDGFYSLYPELIDLERARAVYILKGGPGCGKSTLMRRVGERMEQAGLETEYILCSGDPDSLDGLVLPQLGVAIVDGTAPHVVEAKYPAVVERYVDLGQSYDAAGLQDIREEIIGAMDGYPACYQRAYRCLGAAERLREDMRAALLTDAAGEKLARRARGILARELRPRSGGQKGRVKQRFLGAVTHKGVLCLYDTAFAQCSRVYELADRDGLAHELLIHLLAGAVEGGYDAVACPNPMAPSRLAHLLVPQRGLAFVSTAGETALPRPADRRIHLDGAAEGDVLRRDRPRLHFARKVSAALIGEAVASLSQAKAMHDRLEALYNPYVDFDLVEETARQIGDEILNG